ncbi:MAG: hypothetical protein RMJ53_10915, partial [Chitinophagales bacterium]|nr:hypothetical protein [Chitinophagales bacterium]
PGCYGVRCRFRRDRAAWSLSLSKRSAVAAAHSVRALRIPHPENFPRTLSFKISEQNRNFIFSFQITKLFLIGHNIYIRKSFICPRQLSCRNT